MPRVKKKDLENLVDLVLNKFLDGKPGLLYKTIKVGRLRIENQSPNQTTEAGRLKFETGLDTAYLVIGPSRQSRTVLAKVSMLQGGKRSFTIESKQFKDLVEANANKLKEYLD